MTITDTSSTSVKKFDAAAAQRAEAAARLASNKETPTQAALRNPSSTTEVQLVGGGTTRLSRGMAYLYTQIGPRVKSFNNPDLAMALTKLYHDVGLQNGVPTQYQIAVVAMKYGVPPEELTRRLNQVGGAGGGGVNKANQIANLSAAISDMAKQYGIGFTPEQVTTIAALAQKNDWSTAQIVDELTKNVDWYQLNAGTLKTSLEDFKTVGKQYLVNLDDSTSRNWALAVARGEMTSETVQQSIREAAKIANPWLAQYIDQGLNPIDVLAANRDSIARGLEIDSNSLDLMDQNVINMMTTLDNGVRRLANQSELTNNIRNDSRWKNTQTAKQVSAGVASMLSGIFGRSSF